MGRKQTGERKYFFFYLTCIVTIFEISTFSGCASKANLMLLETQDLMITGDYDGALEKNKQMLKESPQMGDSALFQMGLILAHPENPGKDYKKSLTYFRTLIEQFPDSTLKYQAQIWASVLRSYIDRGKKIEEQRAEIVSLGEKINFLRKDNQAKDKKADELQKDNQLKDKKADELQKDNQLKDKKVDELQQQIEKLKEIDLKKKSISFK